MKWAAAFVLAVAGITLALGRPDAALGHAALRSSDPAANSFLQRPPSQLSLVFTEPLEPMSSSIQLLDAGGRPVTTAPATVSGMSMTMALPQLQPGIYNVLWANVSRVDGHAIRGSFPFTVLNADGSMPDQVNSFEGMSNDADRLPRADGVAVRALSLLGLVVAVAGAVVTLLFGVDADSRTRRGLAMAVYAGVSILLAATLLNFATLRDAYEGVPLREFILETPSGGYWLTRMGLILLMGVATTFILDAPKRTAGALLACSTGFLWAFTATSHAAAGTGSSWAKVIDLGHGVAAAGWVGAVVGIALAARLGRPGPSWHSFVPRFSLLASACVLVLLGTGFLGALVEIDESRKLWETRYGLVLLVKLGLVVPLLVIAAYNANRGKHLLTAGKETAQRRFVRLAVAEVGLGLVVFLAGAMLTQTTVSKSIAIAPERKPFDQIQPAGDLQLRLAIDPNQTGLNTYRVELAGTSGARAEAERVRLTFRYQEDATIGASSLTLAGTESGVFLGQGPFMTLEGRWRVEVEVRRADVDDVIGFFDVRPAGVAVVTSKAGGAWANPAPGLTWNQFGGFVFVLVGLGFALARPPLRRLGREASWAANSATMAGFSFGVLLLFGVHAHEPADGLPSNPVYPDANSIAQGRTLYMQNCVSCHGQTGVPPKGLDLNPYPLDLTVHVPQHPDGQLFKFIDEGVAGTQMRAWGEGAGRLSEEQMWHLVNFLRTLTPVER
ncbi:copper resistance protein CopC [Candidatus Amarobacter glycogenicus]|uniref:copper resistance protein CopC n=1 Tax=Candidatus Amarobacter glycogenicus TaxID=3140699 RepID=UPI003135BFE2|nr:copper resistance protein CopC [Dehalococcoidia bacterium]